MTSPSTFPLGLRIAEVRTSFVCWGIYLAGMTCYCLLYQTFVSASAAGLSGPDLVGTVVLALREWGVWLLTTPLVFRALRRCDERSDRRLLSYVWLGAVVPLASVTFPVSIDYLTGTHSALSSLVIFLPRYVAAFVVVCLVWHVFLRRKPAKEAEAPADVVEKAGHAGPEGVAGNGCQSGLASADIDDEQPPHPETLLVSKGSDECLIRVDRIEHIRAAGNYVEVYSDNQLYLLRATMKQVEDLLPPALFVRIHRSHIVNVNEIERIRTRPSGNGTAHLRCGKVLSMSKKYKARLHGIGRKPAERGAFRVRPNGRETATL